MNNGHINIFKLIEDIEDKGFIECSNIEGDDKEEYESILFYLNFCAKWYTGLLVELDENDIKESERMFKIMFGDESKWKKK